MSILNSYSSATGHSQPAVLFTPLLCLSRCNSIPRHKSRRNNSLNLCSRGTGNQQCYACVHDRHHDEDGDPSFLCCSQHVCCQIVSWAREAPGHPELQQGRLPASRRQTSVPDFPHLLRDRHRCWGILSPPGDLPKNILRECQQVADGAFVDCAPALIFLVGLINTHRKWLNYT